MIRFEFSDELENGSVDESDVETSDTGFRLKVRKFRHYSTLLHIYIYKVVISGCLSGCLHIQLYLMNPSTDLPKLFFLSKVVKVKPRFPS